MAHTTADTRTNGLAYMAKDSSGVVNTRRGVKPHSVLNARHGFETHGTIRQKVKYGDT